MSTNASATLDSFSALLQAARALDEPQRLLFVFVRKFIDDEASAEERASYRRGTGGALKPCLCVDKAVEELGSFEDLVAESRHTDVYWDIVFVSSLSGRGGIPPNHDETEQPLRFMVNAIGQGRVERMVAFDRQGEMLCFT